jgi:hypothetical protein
LTPKDWAALVAAVGGLSLAPLDKTAPAVQVTTVEEELRKPEPTLRKRKKKAAPAA